MRRRLLTRSLLSSLVLPPSAFAQGASASLGDMQRAFEATRQKHGLPSLAGTIVTGKGPGEIVATGLRKAGADIMITDNDKWHLGSETKAMTACLLAKLVEAKSLAWTSTIADVFPERKTSPDYKSFPDFIFRAGSCAATIVNPFREGTSAPGSPSRR